MRSIAALATLATVAMQPQTAHAFGRHRSAPDSGKPKVLMVALGDSMTVGAMSDTSLPRTTDAGKLMIEPGTRSFPLSLPPKMVESQVSENDIHPYLIWDNKGTYSWATGKRVLGHSLRLGQTVGDTNSPEELVVKNFAVNGSKIGNVVNQTKKVIREFQTGKYTRVEYVTMLIGPNDVCAQSGAEGTPLEKMRTQYLEALANLASIPQDKPIHVLMSTILPVYELGRPEIREARSLFGMRCRVLRDKILRYCNRMTTWSTEEGRLVNKGIIDRRNEMIREVVAQANEQYKGKLDIHLSEIWGNVALTRELLAMDCFHPNATAQRLISAMLWFDQPWYPHALPPLDDLLSTPVEAPQSGSQEALDSLD